jgi:hypothetical protein
MTNKVHLVAWLFKGDFINAILLAPDYEGECR